MFAELDPVRPGSIRVSMILFAVVLSLLLVLALVEHLGLPGHLAERIYFGLLILALAIVGLLWRTRSVRRFAVAERATSPAMAGLAIAGCALSGIGLLALPGALASASLTGMAVSAGLIGGLVLATVLFAPYVRKSGAYSLPEFLAARFPEAPIRLFALAIACMATTGLLIAQFEAASIFGEQLFQLTAEQSVMTLLGVVILTAVLGGAHAALRLGALEIGLALLVFVVLGTALWMQGSTMPTDMPALAALMQTLNEANPATMAATLALEPIAPEIFLPIAVTLMLGIAAMPHVHGVFATTRTVRDTRSAGILAVGVLAVLAMLAPVLAFRTLDAMAIEVVGATPRTLPDWVFASGGRDALLICGRPADSIAAILRACREVGGYEGILQPEHVALETRNLAFAAWALSGLPTAFAALVTVVILTVVAGAARMLALSTATMIGHDLYLRMADPKASDHRRLLALRFLIVGVSGAAGYGALMWSTSPVDLAMWSISLLAGTFFPVLALSIWWNRCGGWPALVGMVAGATVTLAYIWRTQFGPDWIAGSGDEYALWFGVSNLAAGLFGGIVCAGLTIVMSFGRPSRADGEAFAEEVRVPRGRSPIREPAA